LVKNVEYRRVREVRRKAIVPKINELPFLKRAGFADESEVRAIFESRSETLSYLDIKIDLAFIPKIVLSPWLNKRLSETVKKVIAGIPGCEDIKVTRSTLVGNTTWKNLGDQAT
jgi:hypothetical protein